ncbi:MAG: hypothetical protein A2X56_13735 [Nitrospirae bacterium GWC2_57_13]|nr:MAG: hypothetical protein A2072_08980 [Nitrospirae bacterium GWC1_57_7]OGW28219.1 MAG: hypothetical protein A2X56_13735 [Nitrospirae bacterium GWC2_57_13]OGW41278.1 MAG: hypothetical protein A2X57_08550 [Nitrospirae bacterium GWD2_57_8]
MPAAPVKVMGMCLPLLLFSACGSVPFADILSVHQAQEHVYVVARSEDRKSGYVKVLDTNRLGVKDKVPLHSDASQQIVSVLREKDGVIVAVREGQGKAAVYRLQAGVPLQRLGQIRSQNFLLSGSDQEFIYSISTPESKGKPAQVNGMRYDRAFKVQNAFHFSENPGLLVINITEDNEAYWYTCLERKAADPAPSPGELNGRLVVVRKAKDTKEYSQFVYEIERLRNISTVADSGSLWIFATGDEKNGRGNYSDHKIVQFSKKDTTFRAQKMLLALVAIPSYGIPQESEILWAFGSGNRIVQVQKKDLTYTTKALPQNVRTSSGSERRFAAAETETSLLLGSYNFQDRVPGSSGEMPKPLILRYTKTDMELEMVPLKDTMGDTLMAIPMNLCLIGYRSCLLDPVSKFKREDE